MVHVASFWLRVVSPIVRSLGFNRASAATASAGPAAAVRDRTATAAVSRPGRVRSPQWSWACSARSSIMLEGDRVALGGPKRLTLGLLTSAARPRRAGRRSHRWALARGPTGVATQDRPVVRDSALRRALGSSAGAIRSEAAGYRLDPAVVPIDPTWFQTDVRGSRVGARVEGAIACLPAPRWADGGATPSPTCSTAQRSCPQRYSSKSADWKRCTSCSTTRCRTAHERCSPSWSRPSSRTHCTRASSPS